jgi:hypothetical protein
MKGGDLTSHMIAPKTLLNTPLTSRTLLRRLRYNFLTRNLFLLLEIPVSPRTVSTHLRSKHHCHTCNHTPHKSRHYARLSYDSRNDSSYTSYSGILTGQEDVLVQTCSL